MKKIAILGSTGSIGTQALEVIEKSRHEFEVCALVCGSNIELLKKQIQKFKPAIAVVAHEEDARELMDIFPEVKILFGDEGIIEAVKGEADVVLNALMGIRGFLPTYEAIMAGKDVALANKETLVAGGEIIMKAAGEKGVSLTPIDSEHSAIFQCMQGQRPEDVSGIILTGSGGPFRGFNRDMLKKVTVEDALKHPNWSMGKKITIDSATLMNKGLEFIEAKWLFGFEPDAIQVVIHPQSIIHSMIEMNDGAVIAQMGVPDMKLPIAYALTYPERKKGVSDRLCFKDLTGGITFEEPDTENFPCLKMAIDAIKKGGTAPAALNGANEVLVAAFLNKEIGFLDIPEMLGKVMDSQTVQYDLSVDIILEADRWAREKASDLIKERII